MFFTDCVFKYPGETDIILRLQFWHCLFYSYLHKHADVIKNAHNIFLGIVFIIFSFSFMYLHPIQQVCTILFVPFFCIISHALIRIPKKFNIIAKLRTSRGTNSPNDGIWWQRSGSALVQVMAWCLMAPSDYLNQYWLIINPERAGTELSRFNYVNIMAADALAPYVARTSAAMILTT